MLESGRFPLDPKDLIRLGRRFGIDRLDPGIFPQLVADGVAAAAEVICPDNELGAPTWYETDIIERTLAYLESLPPQNGLMLKAMFFFAELSPTILSAQRSRLSRLDPDIRLDYLRSLRHSPFYYLRILGDAVKAVMTMMYLSHPDALAYVGHFKACQKPHPAEKA